MRLWAVACIIYFVHGSVYGCADYARIENNVEKMRETRAEKEREAEMLREESERIQAEDDQLEQIKRQKTKQLKETYDKIMENRQKMKEAEAIMDEEENEEIRVYAAAKKKMAQIKHDRENEALRLELRKFLWI